MLDTFVEKATDWDEPNEVTVPTALYGMVSVIVLMLCLIPTYTVWSIIVPSFIVLTWIIFGLTIKFHPHRQYLKQYRDLGIGEQNLWKRYNDLPADVRSQLPTMTMGDIKEMNNAEIDEANDAIRSLTNVWNQQQQLLRSPRHSQFLDTARDLTESMRESNKELAG